MFGRIFKQYLYSKGKLNDEQMNTLSADDNHTRVKLGTIAVSERLMTEEQAMEVNELQSITDRRFGDIAIEKGYLTASQLDSLLKQQGNSFLHFVQSLIDNGYYNLEQIEGFVDDYQDDLGFTNSDMDDLVSGDLIRTINVYLPHQAELYNRLCGVAIRTIVRLIESDCYVEKAFLTDEFSCERFASQSSFGQHDITAGFGGDGDSLLAIAEPFADEEFPEVDMDALDAVGEFVNCIDGLLAVDLSYENVDVDMRPPSFYDKPVKLTGKQFCVVPVVIKGKKVYFVMSIDSELNASQD